MDRTSPSAIVHSNVAMLSSAQAVRTRLTARISSDVSMTTIGVDELINTFRRSSPSAKSFSFVKLHACAGQLFDPSRNTAL